MARAFEDKVDMFNTSRIAPFLYLLKRPFLDPSLPSMSQKYIYMHRYMYSIHAHAPHRSTYAHRNRQVHMYIQCMHEDMHKHMAAHIHMHLST